MSKIIYNVFISLISLKMGKHHDGLLLGEYCCSSTLFSLALFFFLKFNLVSIVISFFKWL